jgi:hypothetical protein
MLPNGFELLVPKELVLAYPDWHDLGIVVRNPNRFLNAEDQLGT